MAVVKFLAANGTSALAAPLVYFVQRDFTDSLATELREQGAVLRLQITATPGGGGHLGICWVDMCRPALQIGTPF